MKAARPVRRLLQKFRQEKMVAWTRVCVKRRKEVADLRHFWKMK